MSIVTVIPKIEGEFDRETGCINWQGSKFGNGYGRKWIDGKTVLVHRLVLESKIAGFIDSGDFACHTCNNRSCINPAHLVAESAAENTGQMMGRDRQTPRRKSIPGIDRLSPINGVAEVYSANPVTIHNINCNLTWKPAGEGVPIARPVGCLDRRTCKNEFIQARKSIPKRTQEFEVSRSIIREIKNNVTDKGV
ncbi:HNH endonuclease [Tychonema sp. LEGE 07203]|uniref:HNH endonuclease n=1 Tax=Tychonema sp. LEGE 07203 TaxID=1828671 RepID=UPI001881A123|nr:HNH endonuclease [Tychonema sp. LEGE 07203]MBE9096091.1 HNH endonuclease [Tychonema sp. LEGE 07203]